MKSVLFAIALAAPQMSFADAKANALQISGLETVSLGLCVTAYFVMLVFLVAVGILEMVDGWIAVRFPGGWSQVLEWLKGKGKSTADLVGAASKISKNTTTLKEA